MITLPELSADEIDRIACMCSWTDETTDGDQVEVFNYEQFYEHIREALQRKLATP